jgi:hypothetical protein
MRTLGFRPSEKRMRIEIYINLLFREVCYLNSLSVAEFI